jgi:hypothetical protein
MVLLLALDGPKSVRDVICKLRAKVHCRRPAVDVLWNVGNAAAVTRSVRSRRLAGVE